MLEILNLMKKWALGDFYFEITDHFGLDRADVMKFQYAPMGGIGFAA